MLSSKRKWAAGTGVPDDNSAAAGSSDSITKDATGSTSLDDATFREGLLPFPLYMQHTRLWAQMSHKDKQALRMLNKQSRREANDCVRALRIYVPPGPQHTADLAKQFATFPMLEKLKLRGRTSPELSTTGEDLGRLLEASAPVISRCLSELSIKGFLGISSFPSAALFALRSSLETLFLSECRLDGPVFAALAACAALRSLRVEDVEFSNHEVAATLCQLKQVRSNNPCSHAIMLSYAIKRYRQTVQLNYLTAAWCFCKHDQQHADALI
jgi:hypothetical protein